MRIGIDARALRDGFPGIGRYVHSLLTAMQPELGADTLVIFYDPESTHSRYNLAPLAVRPDVQTVPFAYGLRSLAQQWALPRLLRQLAIDVFHAPYYLTAYLGLPCPLVLSLFDLIPLACPPAMPSHWERLRYWLALRLALTAARRVIVPSEASRADLARFFRGAARRAAVIPGAAAPAFGTMPPEAVQRVRERYHLPARYILHVGTNKPHKNLETLLAAYARYDAQAPAAGRAGLVLVGAHSPRYLDARAWAGQHGLGDSLLTLGNVPDGDLAALYAGAACVAVPSLYEGFGLPVLEAMACGAPVACSSTSSLLEMAGDAALLLAPCDVPAWSAAFAHVLGDASLRTTLRARGLARAAQFSWPAIARATLQVYHELADASA